MLGGLEYSIFNQVIHQGYTLAYPYRLNNFFKIKRLTINYCIYLHILLVVIVIILLMYNLQSILINIWLFIIHTIT